MYIVMLVEQHIRKFAFVENESDVVDMGLELLQLRGVATGNVEMTGTNPGINAYGEANRIMFVDVFDIRAVPIRTDWTYNVLD